MTKFDRIIRSSTYAQEQKEPRQKQDSTGKYTSRPRATYDLVRDALEKMRSAEGENQMVESEEEDVITTVPRKPTFGDYLPVNKPTRVQALKMPDRESYENLNAIFIPLQSKSKVVPTTNVVEYKSNTMGKK